MSVVALRLSGPLQSWGSGSKFVRRATEMSPTKSGIIGLIAAASGLRRTDPLTELLGLRLGVRLDQPGRLLRDFQTAQRPTRDRGGSIMWKSLPLSYRFYLTDATYLAVLEGERGLLESIDAAVRSPVFPLYLGRRSCPPAGPVALGLDDRDLTDALASWPWLASERHQQRRRERTVRLEIVRDAEPTDPRAEMWHDEPVSFDPNRRIYAWRSIVRDSVTVPNPHGISDVVAEHEPMAPLGG